MWFSALAVLWLPNNPRRAAWVFLAGIGAGFTLGWVQQMRGQHFLTHTLWTAWLSSALVVALIGVFSAQLKGANQARKVLAAV
jgi:membrane-associated PAP2 superfamily phosphatase